jgi:SAM-dependent methyltransferase
MQYDPIKKTLGRFFSGPLFMKKLFFRLLDLLLVRTWHVKKALRSISKDLPDNSSVLDAGTGFGQYSWWMSKTFQGWKIKAVDIDKEHIENCISFFKEAGLSGRIDCRQCDLTSLDELSTYNIIVSVDVMEHIEDDEIVFSNFYRALKEEGMVVISTPSDRGGSDVRSGHNHSFIDEHVRDGYSIPEITGKLIRAGFKSISPLYTYGRPGHISWKLSMKYPIRLIGVSRAFFILLPFYYLIIFPVAVILNILDVNLKHNSGTGLLVTAKR